MVCSCESDILFTEAQPVGIELQNKMPEKFIGKYAFDFEKMSAGDLPKKFSVSKLPFLIITADSLFFMEYRSEKLHENFVDGVSYELRDNYLFRDNKSVSLFPVEKEGDYYNYVNRIDTLAIPVALDSLRSPEVGKPVMGLSQIISMDNYFVLNFLDLDKNLWNCFYFGVKSPNEIVIKCGLPYEEISATKIKAVTQVKKTEDKYILTLSNEISFKKIVDQFFVNKIYLKKVE